MDGAILKQSIIVLAGDRLCLHTSLNCYQSRRSDRKTHQILFSAPVRPSMTKRYKLYDWFHTVSVFDQLYIRDFKLFELVYSNDTTVRLLPWDQPEGTETPSNVSIGDVINSLFIADLFFF